MRRNKSIYVPKTKLAQRSKSLDVIERIIIISIMTAFTTAIVIGSAFMIVLLTQ